MDVEVEIASQRTSLVCARLDSTSEDIRLAPAKALIEKLAKHPHPIFVLGDFNRHRYLESFNQNIDEVRFRPFISIVSEKFVALVDV